MKSMALQTNGDRVARQNIRRRRSVMDARYNVDY